MARAKIIRMTDSTHKYPVWLWMLAALLVLLAAYGVRVHLLGAQSLWNDEGSAYVQATRPLPEIAQNAARDIHPPLYYALLAVWRALTGESEFALRALSALASLLTVAFAYGIGRRLYGRFAAITAALLVGFNTFQIYYAQEARMYALLALWAAAAMWALINLTLTETPRHRWRYAAALALLNAAGLWTQYVYPALMLAQGALFVLWMLARMRARLPVRHVFALYVAANVATLILFAPWVSTAWAQLTTWPNTGAPPEIGEQIAVISAYLTVGVTYPYAAYGVPVAFVLLFGLLTRSARPLAWWRMSVPVIWALTLAGGFIAVGLFREANLKFLLPAQAGFALWIARGLWVIWTLPTPRDRPLVPILPKIAAISGAALLTLSLISTLPALYHAPEYQRDNYRAIVAAIQADTRDDKAVILNAPGQIEAFDYYARGTLDIHPLPIGMTVDEAATTRAVEALLRDNTRLYAVLWGTDERDPDGVVESLLDRAAFEIDDRWFGSVRLVRYATTADLGAAQPINAAFGENITLESYTLSADSVTRGDALLVRLTWQTDAPLDRRYKVFVQLLNPDGTLAAQRDSEPSGGLIPTVTWAAGDAVQDHHALVIPPTLAAGSGYTLIVGLYDSADASARLPTATGDYVTLGSITVR